MEALAHGTKASNIEFFVFDVMFLITLFKQVGKGIDTKSMLLRPKAKKTEHFAILLIFVPFMAFPAFIDALNTLVYNP